MSKAKVILDVTPDLWDKGRNPEVVAVVARTLVDEIHMFEIRLSCEFVRVVVKTDMVERYDNYRAQAVEIEGKLEDALNKWWANRNTA